MMLEENNCIIHQSSDKAATFNRVSASGRFSEVLECCCSVFAGRPPKWVDIKSKLSHLGYKEVGESSSALSVEDVSDTPEAILNSGFIAFQVEFAETKAPQVRCTWTAFFKSDQASLYIAAPSTMSASSRQSLVSLLELAASLNCATAWVYIDRQRPDFMSIVLAFNHLGFQLFCETVKNARGNKMFALLRCDIE
jgi:hypothetical protein